MSAAHPALTATLARASEKSREALALAGDEAAAWIEEIRSGARSSEMQCVACGRGPPLEDNHIAGRRHGELTVPMCPPCHAEFTRAQRLWDARWTSPNRTPELDEALLLRGLIELLRIRARHVPAPRSGAFLALADSLAEQYAQIARRTL